MSQNDSVTPTEYRIDLEHFSGPVDLLLYLIRKEEVDIHDIPISRILDQYMNYLEMMDSIDLDDAGDFLVMASTLMVIKSKMLLPIEEVDLAEELDPRYELVQQLLEYKALKERAKNLENRAEVYGRRVGRPESARPDAVFEPDSSLDDVQIWHIFELFSNVLKATGGNVKRERVIQGREVPVREFAGQLRTRLLEGPLSLRGLVGEVQNKSELIGYFLAVLILVKTQAVDATQHEDFGDIHIALKDDGEDSSVEQVLELEDDFRN